MGTKELRLRETWQDYSGRNATIAEHSFFEVFLEEFKGTDFRIRPKPNEFNKIYVDVKLSDDVLKEIYNPTKPIIKHGVSPDYAIDNIKTKKTLYVEVKRQDGWVEGKARSAGRGNAHERSCKLFTPGLLNIMRVKGKLGNEVLPFWAVYQGDIARDPCRVREITLWFEKYTAHFFLWRDSKDPAPLIRHFNKYLKHLLE